jgi:hypothetical protein
MVDHNSPENVDSLRRVLHWMSKDTPRGGFDNLIYAVFLEVKFDQFMEEYPKHKDDMLLRADFLLSFFELTTDWMIDSRFGARPT